MVSMRAVLLVWRAVFGRCAQMQTGPVAMTSLIAAAAVGGIIKVTQGEPTPRVHRLDGGSGVMVGVLRIGLG